MVESIQENYNIDIDSLVTKLKNLEESVFYALRTVQKIEELQSENKTCLNTIRLQIQKPKEHSFSTEFVNQENNIYSAIQDTNSLEDCTSLVKTIDIQSVSSNEIICSQNHYNESNVICKKQSDNINWITTKSNVTEQNLHLLRKISFKLNFSIQLIYPQRIDNYNLVISKYDYLGNSNYSLTGTFDYKYIENDAALESAAASNGTYIIPNDEKIQNQTKSIINTIHLIIVNNLKYQSFDIYVQQIKTCLGCLEESILKDRNSLDNFWIFEGLYLCHDIIVDKIKALKDLITIAIKLEENKLPSCDSLNDTVCSPLIEDIVIRSFDDYSCSESESVCAEIEKKSKNNMIPRNEMSNHVKTTQKQMTKYIPLSKNEVDKNVKTLKIKMKYYVRSKNKMFNNANRKNMILSPVINLHYEIHYTQKQTLNFQFILFILMSIVIISMILVMCIRSSWFQLLLTLDFVHNGLILGYD